MSDPARLSLQDGENARHYETRTMKHDTSSRSVVPRCAPCWGRIFAGGRWVAAGNKRPRGAVCKRKNGANQSHEQIANFSVWWSEQVSMRVWMLSSPCCAFLFLLACPCLISPPSPVVSFLPQNLKRGGFRGLTNAYCQLSVGRQGPFSTDVVFDSSNPSWEHKRQTFEFRVRSLESPCAFYSAGILFAPILHTL